MSFSSKQLELSFPDYVVTVEIKRYLAPEIVGKLLRSLPMGTYAYPALKIVYMKLNIGSGGRRKIHDLTRGDVFYDIKKDSMGIVLEDLEASSSQVKIGEVSEGLEKVKGVRGVVPVRIVEV